MNQNFHMEVGHSNPTEGKVSQEQAHESESHLFS